MLSQLRTLVSPCSLNNTLHSSLIINWTVAAVVDKSLCVFLFIQS